MNGLLCLSIRRRLGLGSSNLLLLGLGLRLEAGRELLDDLLAVLDKVGSLVEDFELVVLEGIVLAVWRWRGGWHRTGF